MYILIKISVLACVIPDTLLWDIGHSAWNSPGVYGDVLCQRCCLRKALPQGGFAALHCELSSDPQI